MRIHLSRKNLCVNREYVLELQSMPLVVAMRKWKKENFKTATRKVIEALGQLPEGVSPCCSYITADKTGAWCAWQAKSAAQVKDFLANMVPEMKTEVVPGLDRSHMYRLQLPRMQDTNFGRCDRRSIDP